MIELNKTYTLTKEPSWSTGGRKGRQVMVIQMNGYLAFKIIDETLPKEFTDVTWPANLHDIS